MVGVDLDCAAFYSLLNQAFLVWKLGCLGSHVLVVPFTALVNILRLYVRLLLLIKNNWGPIRHHALRSAGLFIFTLERLKALAVRCQLTLGERRR